MFGVPIEGDHGNANYLFVRNTIKNIDFALISLGYIFNAEYFDKEKDIYGDKNTYFFFHIQNVLNACSGICNVFYNTGFRNTFARQRSRQLRDLYGINIQIFPNIFNKKIRNTNEHFDERIDMVNGEIGDCNVIDNNTPEAIEKEIYEQRHLRTLDLKRNVYITYVVKQQKHEQRLELEEVDLTHLYNELVEMKRILI